MCLYDAKGQLTQVKSGVTASNLNGLTQVSYTYDALGRVATVVDGQGRTVTMQYDVNENLTVQYDSAGNRLERTYNAQNQLLTETLFAGSGATDPLVTRYVYDGGSKNLLRFVVSAEGRVTEYRYNALGLRTSTIEYSATAYPITTLPAGTVPTESQLQTWVGTQDLTRTTRSDAAYDFRGQLQTLTTYGAVDATGAGGAGTGSVTQFVYNDRGQLIQTVTPDGKGISQSIYDGLGRVVTTVAKSSDGTLSTTTLTQYDDAAGKTTVTLANGLVTTSTFDKAGRLVTIVQSAAGTALGTSTLYYDADGRLVMTQLPTGERSWNLYDGAGQKVADVDSTGNLTEYAYDASGKLTEVIGYATAVDTTGLVDASGNPIAVALSALRPVAAAKDAKSWSVYDGAGRLAWQIDALGYVTRTEYDGASRVLAVTRFGTAVATSGLGNGVGVTVVVGAAGTATVHVLPNATTDRVVSRIYDRQGLLRATIDGEGFLTELRYDASGRAVQTIAYANKIWAFTDAASIASRVAAARASDDLSGLIPAAAPEDISTFTYYDSRDQKIGEVDGERYLTEFVYDANGRLVQTLRYEPAVTAAITASSKLSDLRPAPPIEVQITRATWDALGRLSTQTNVEGTVTAYAYDNVGNLVSTTLALDTTDKRTLLTHYDVQGRVTAELSAEGAALLTGGQTQAQIDAIWSQYATKYTYDAAGRRTTSTDANGNRTVFFYDDVGRLRFVVNALGEISETAYDVLGHVTSTSRYATPLAAATVTTLQGGVLSSAANATAAQALAQAKLASSDNSTSTFDYDARGSRVGAVDPEGGTSTAQVNAFGEVTSTAQALDATNTLTSTSAYDRRGLTTDSVADAGDVTHVNALQRREYDAFGRVIRAVDANNNVREQKYDRRGRVVQTINPVLTSRYTTYDAFDRVVTQVDAFTNTTRYAYDTAKREVTLTTPEGVVVSTIRNRLGDIQSVTQRVMDGRTNTTTYRYDLPAEAGKGRLLSTTRLVDGVPVTTTSGYDRTGRLVETTDANGNRVTYEYDAANRILTRTVDPGAGHLALVTSYLYDAKGQQYQVTDPNQVMTLILFDRKGEVTTVTVDPGGTGHLNLVTEYVYDKAGRVLTEKVLTEEGALRTETQHSYDGLGRRTSTVIDPGDALHLNITRSFAYDKNGNVVTATSNTNVTRYVYDAANRLVYTVNAAGGVEKNDYDAEGRITRTTVFATPISLNELATTPTKEDVDALVSASPTTDVTQHRVYDGDARLKYTVDGIGSVTSFTYDESGNVVDRITYANRIDLATWTSGTAPPVVADAAHDERVRTTYDALNRATFTVDGTGAVVGLKYDANGNVIDRIAYANRIPTSTAATEDAIASAVALEADAARDAHVRRVYDAANRLIWSVDGTGAVTQQVFDRNGNLVKQVAYARPIAAGDAPSSVTAMPGADRASLLGYDNANRLVYQVDAQGGVTQQVYDANGNVLQRIVYATHVAAPSAATDPATAAASVWTVINDAAGEKRVTSAVYDAANRLVFAVDAMGALTENKYDAVGNVIATTAYARPVTPGTVPAIGTVPATDPADRTTLLGYDAAERLVYSVDALGYVTKREYDGAGRMTVTTLYDRKATGLAIGADRNAIADAVVLTTGVDRISSVGYDPAGNVISSTVALTDVLTRTERYTYDGAGRKLTFTNGNNATWTYAYDAAGHLVSETSPAVDLTRVTWNATRLEYEPVVVPNQAIVTRIEYDALGNVTKRIEAAGLDEERATSYEYDVMGRQVATTFAAVAVYDESPADLAGNGSTGTAQRVETDPQVHSSRIVYDSFGDAVVGIDVMGNRSYKAYDSLGRVRFEVDALGYVTGYERDNFGDVTTLTRYAERPALSASEAAPPNEDAIELALAGMPPGAHAADRSISTSYDLLGRASEVTQPQVWVSDGDGSAGYLAAATVKSTYDAFGDVVEVSSLARGGTAPLWATSYHVFDRRGQKTRTVDPLGYVTTQGYDSAGNLTGRTEYANALMGTTVDGKTTYGAANPTESTDDRAIAYTYDRANRKMSETVGAARVGGTAAVGVEYSTGPTGTSTRGPLTTVFGYDAVGNLTSTTNPLNETSYTTYDALGRIKAVAAPVTSTVRGNLAPLTTFGRDALGDVTAKTEYANGANSVGHAAPASADPDADRVTLTKYDSRGNAVRTTDALGFRHYMSYDAAGRLVKAWQGVTGNDEVAHTLFAVFQYDALGRQTAVITPASTSVLVVPNPNVATIETVTQEAAGTITMDVRYNAFGDLVQRSTSHTGVTPAPQDIEFFEYDAAGRAWRTNTGDGNVKILLYDLLGNQSGQITSNGTADLKIYSSADAAGSDRTLRHTDFQRDHLGRVLRQTLPSRPDGTPLGYRPVVDQAFDRWGNVVSQSDVHVESVVGNVTTFRYNHSDQVIQQTQPHVGAMTASGAIVDATPTTQVYYDALGRQVAVRDANGNVNGQLWSSAGQLIEERHADGGVVTRVYDAFGDLVQLWDAIRSASKPAGNLTTYVYDKLGRNTAVISDVVGVYEASGDYVVGNARDATGAVVTRITTRNDYDEAGRKIRETNGAGEATQYAFDLRGNVIATTQAMGQVSRAAFDANGNRIAELDPIGSAARWTYDAFGRVIAHTDLGNATYAYTYDKARELVSETNSRGEDRAYTYDEAGQLTGIRDNKIDQTTTYAYNANGRRVLEQTLQAGITYQDQWLAYDALGRLVRVGAMDGISIQVDYDKVGNRMRQVTAYSTEAQRTVTPPRPTTGKWYVLQWDPYTETSTWVEVSTSDPYRPQYAGSYDGQEVYDDWNSYNWYRWSFDPAPAPYIVYDVNPNTEQLWYAYDSMNRQILADGAINGNAADIANLTATQGHIIAYDANGNRITDTRFATQVNIYQAPTPGAWYYDVSDESGTYTVRANPGEQQPSFSGTTEAQTSVVTVQIGTDWLGQPVYSSVTYTWRYDPQPALQYLTRAGAVTEFYTYDALNRLSTVATGKYEAIGAPTGEWRLLDVARATLLDTRLYDGGSRVVQTGVSGALAQAFIDPYTGGRGDANNASSRITFYDRNGRIVKQRVRKSDGTWDYDLENTSNVVKYRTVAVQATDGWGNPVFDHAGNAVYYAVALDENGVILDDSGNPLPVLDANGERIYLTAQESYTVVESGFDDAGNLKHYQIHQSGLWSYYDFAAAKYDGYRTGTTIGRRGDNYGNPGYSTQQYDANGFLIAIDDSSNDANDRTFVNDATGHALLKTQQNNRVRELVVDGNVMGVYGVGTDPATPRSPGGALNYTTQGEFNLNFQSITSASALTSPTSYVVHAGETLQSIAQAVYGDSSLWYLIADANGLSGNEDLRVGQAVSVPARVGGTHNNATTFRAYDPSRIVGDTTPNLPVPSGGGGGGCSILRIVLVIVIIAVAVVATIYTAGAATAVMSSSLGTLSSFGATMSLGATALAGGSVMTAAGAVSLGAAGVIGAAVGGAVGSVVSQGLSIAFGLQDSFDWRQVAMGAVSSSVGAGVGSLTSGASQGASGMKMVGGWAVAGARAAVANATTQGVSYMLGLQHSFNWRSVIASAAGGAAGSMLRDVANLGMDDTYGKLQPGADRWGRNLVAGQIAAFGGGIAAAAARGGRVVVQRIATDSFGNAMAQSTAEAMMSPPEPAFGSFKLQLDTSNMPAPGPSVGDMTLKSSVFKEDLRNTATEDPAAVDNGLGKSEGDPASGAAPAPASTSTPYTVRSGDNLSSILGTSDPRVLGAVMHENGLTSSLIRPGQVLSIPDDAYNRTFSDPDRSAVGQSALDEDNARLASVRAAAQRPALGMGDLRVLDEQALSAATSARTVEVPQYDAMGNFTGITTEVSASSSPGNPPNFAGPGAVTTWDSAQRSKYLETIAANSDEAVNTIRQIAADPALTQAERLAAAEEVAMGVSAERNALRSATQSRLSPGGAILSQAIEQEHPWAKIYAKYASPNEMQTFEDIARAAGRSSPVMTGLAKFGKVAGPVGLAVGVGASAYEIYEAAPGEGARVAAGEVGSFVGGAAASTGGMALGAGAAAVIGTSLGVATGPIGWAALGLGALGAAAGGYGGSLGGRWLGTAAYDASKQPGMPSEYDDLMWGP